MLVSSSHHVSLLRFHSKILALGSNRELFIQQPIEQRQQQQQEREEQFTHSHHVGGSQWGSGGGGLICLQTERLVQNLLIGSLFTRMIESIAPLSRSGGFKWRWGNGVEAIWLKKCLALLAELAPKQYGKLDTDKSSTFIREKGRENSLRIRNYYDYFWLQLLIQLVPS